MSQIFTSTRTVQAGVAALDAATICEAFQVTAAAKSDRVALRTPDDSYSLTFGEYAARVRRVAAGLAALGVSRGDTVALMMTNRPEFNLVDMAAMHLGAVPFSVYNTSSPQQVEYVFSDAENAVVVCESRFLETIRAAGSGLKLKHIVCVDGGDTATVSLVELMAMGSPDFDFDATWRAVQADDVVTLIYTSGTTGPPKGVQLTHRSVIAGNRGCSAFLPGHDDASMLSYLPSAHIADRWATQYYASATFGATVTCVADMTQLIPGLISARPTMWGGVPRIHEKIMAALQAQGLTDPGTLSKREREAVLAKIGLDRVRWSVSAAAPIAVEVLQYFNTLGLRIQELWGMSETSCCATINPVEDIRIGTVGQVLPGVELMVATDGEALIRGAVLMAGYRNAPERTAEAIDADGWMHTGDVVEVDDDGYVKIVDRKKELIINAAGKNMSPAAIEQCLKASHALIGQAVCIGDRRRYNTALLVLDPDAASAYAAQIGLADGSIKAVVADPELRQILADAVATANSQLSRVEQIKKFCILDVDWLPGSDELTPTMKLKRKPIADKYATEIESMYID